MTFEAAITIGNGGLTARLEPAANRVEIETHGIPSLAEIEAALPRLLEHLAARSGLPVRYEGKIYLPRPERAGKAPSGPLPRLFKTYPSYADPTNNFVIR